MTFGSAVDVIYHIRKAGLVPCVTMWCGERQIDEQNAWRHAKLVSWRSRDGCHRTPDRRPGHRPL